MSDPSSKEREILVVMRKVLAQVIKDTTPPSQAMKHPLSEQTIHDVRNCLGLISLRERELADAAGAAQERPYYTDQKPAAEVVPITRIGKPSKNGEE
ncbi:MAG: segregation and condensation protein A [Chromatiaceae bacterium]|nr:segregation and condensation protein A [Chromatiaceae bacterium]